MKGCLLKLYLAHSLTSPLPRMVRMKKELQVGAQGKNVCSNLFRPIITYLNICSSLFLRSNKKKRATNPSFVSICTHFRRHVWLTHSKQPPSSSLLCCLTCRRVSCSPIESWWRKNTKRASRKDCLEKIKKKLIKMASDKLPTHFLQFLQFVHIKAVNLK